jgi:hypothetical protein
VLETLSMLKNQEKLLDFGHLSGSVSCTILQNLKWLMLFWSIRPYWQWWRV